jgi:hypothetical protein
LSDNERKIQKYLLIHVLISIFGGKLFFEDIIPRRKLRILVKEIY